MPQNEEDLEEEYISGLQKARGPSNVKHTKFHISDESKFPPTEVDIPIKSGIKLGLGLCIGILIFYLAVIAVFLILGLIFGNAIGFNPISLFL